jgi:diadenosine tetraphosphate (Ap4A) HIT family hydrolase
LDFNLADNTVQSNNCPFCSLAKERITAETEHGLAFLDGFPISEGHTLVIPKRHVESLFELTPAEQSALWMLVAQVRSSLAVRLKPDAFNIGVNDGAAAGQTVPHAHIHVIPRRNGDVPDPRGGVRWVLPAKAKYWS